MNICVMMSGILDPKWPLPQNVDYIRDPGALNAIPRKLSPFDEAALEVALKLRDAVPGTTISVYMPEGPGAENLMRMIAAHKPDHVALLQIRESARSDPGEFARQIAACVTATDDAGSLWLIGREFGDLDDGALSAFLARAGNASLLAMAEEIWPDAAGMLHAKRTRSTATEWIRVPNACVVTVTNAKSNRLRHPLMKNVMLAKKMIIARIACPEAATLEPRVTPSQLLEVPHDVRGKSAPIAAAAGLHVQVEAVFQLLSTAYPS